MDAIKIVLLCVAAALVAVSLRVQRPEMATVLAMAAGVVALLLSMGAVTEVVSGFSDLSARAGLAEGSVQLMLRACGISLLCEFGAGLCKDAGEGVLAQRIEFGGRVALLSMCVPLLLELMEGLSTWLP